MQGEAAERILSLHGSLMTLWAHALVLAPRLVSALVLLLIFWIAARIASTLISKAFTSRNVDPDITRLGGRIAWLTILAFGLITALGTVGIDVKALVAGLGLTGFALGFALRDSISNLLSGVLILVYRPFKRGDYVEFAGLQGIVRETDLRYTLIETDEKRILIPNSNLFTTPVTVLKVPPSPKE